MAGLLVLLLVAALVASSERPGVTAAPAAQEPAASLFGGDDRPAGDPVTDDARGVELGVGFSPAVDGELVGLRFYRVAGDTSAHDGSLWTATGVRLAEVAFPAGSSTGWASAAFDQPVPLSAGAQYVASYHTDGPYAADQGFFDSEPSTAGPVDFAAPTGATPGLYSYGDTPVVPASSYLGTNYWVDVQFVPTGAATGTAPPSVLAQPWPSAPPTPEADPQPSPGAPGGFGDPSAPTTPTGSSSGTGGSTGPSGSGSGSGSGGGWPGPGNTGVPAGTVLTRTGAMTVTTPGAVVDGKQIDGDLTIRASNVTVRNTLVNGRIDTGDAGAYSGILIQDTEVDGGGDDGNGIGVGYSGFTCLRCDVHGWGKGFGLVRNAVVQDSWVHDLVVSGDPGNGGSHNEAILSIGGSGFTITGNRLDAGDEPNFSASLALYSQAELIRDVLVQGNLFNGGGYCVYAGSTNGRQAQNVRFLQNTFGSSVSATCGWYGPATAYSSGSGNIWSGNVTSAGVAVGTPPE